MRPQGTDPCVTVDGMSAPLIGVSTSITTGKHPERAYLNSAYIAAVQQAGGVPVPLLPQSDVSAERDALEIALVETALERGLPLLAICRGIQVLNMARGGSLHQDVASSPGTPIAHSQKAPRHEPTHGVKVEADSRLGDVLGAHDLDVNSMHHQAVKGLGRGLRAVAFSADGLIEAVELVDRSQFVLGVQWHPEEQAPHQPAAQRLFAALIAAARK